MAISFYFVNNGFTPDKYEEAIMQLNAADPAAPAGRTFHAALEMNGENQRIRHLRVTGGVRGIRADQ